MYVCLPVFNFFLGLSLALRSQIRSRQPIVPSIPLKNDTLNYWLLAIICHVERVGVCRMQDFLCCFENVFKTVNCSFSEHSTLQRVQWAAHHCTMFSVLKCCHSAILQGHVSSPQVSLGTSGGEAHSSRKELIYSRSWSNDCGRDRSR